MAVLGLIIAAIAGAFTTLAKIYRFWPFLEQDDDITPRETPMKPITEDFTPKMTPDSTLDFSTPQNAFHSVRVICDEMGLTWDEKTLICACVYQESEFKNGAVGRNRNKAGQVTSTDWGICQINDYFNIGPGKPFPSVEYVVANPEKCVRWMITCYKQGQLRLWSSYSTGAYKKWLPQTSAMWKLYNPQGVQKAA